MSPSTHRRIFDDGSGDSRRVVLPWAQTLRMCLANVHQRMGRSALTFICVAVVVAFFAAISVNWAGHLRVLVRRMLNPTLDVGYPTRTKIESITGDATLQVGAPITISVVASGRIPDKGTLYVKPKDAPWERLVLPQGRDQHFAFRFPDVFQSFEYRVRLGDARSKRYQVTEIPAIQPHTTEYRRHAVGYPCCGYRTRAAYDEAKIPASPFGPRLMAIMALVTGIYHLSRRKAATLLCDLLGVRVSLGALSAVEARVSDAVQPAVRGGVGRGRPRQGQAY